MLKGSSVELLVLLFTNMWVSVKGGEKKSKLHNFPALDEVYGVENTRDSSVFPDKNHLKAILPWWSQLEGRGLKRTMC